MPKKISAQALARKEARFRSQMKHRENSFSAPQGCVLTIPPDRLSQGTLFVPQGEVPSGFTDALLPLEANPLVIQPKVEG